MSTQFEVGDKVRAFGVDGVVVQVDGDKPSVRVKFHDDHHRWFNEDGKYQSWHKEPSIILVEKAKKEEPIIQWYSVTVWIKGERAPCIYSYLYSGKEHFLTALGTKEDKFNWIKLTPVCKTQGNKLVEVE